MKLNFNFDFIFDADLTRRKLMEKTSYKTRQRTQILDCLQENEEASLTVDDIVSKLFEKGISVGRTTVYRYLESLVQSGEVRRFSRDGKKSAAFQFTENHGECSNHVHLRCKKCGKFFHLGCECMNEANAHLLKNHGFSVDNEKTVIIGLCADCLKGENENGVD